MANIFIEESTMAAIGDAIRAKTGKSEGILPSDMPAEIESISVGAGDDDGSYDEGYVAGKKDEYDAFWDTYQDNGARTSYTCAFYGSGWRNANYKPKYPFIGLTTAASMYVGSRMTTITTPLDLSGCTDCSYMFSQCTSLRTITSINFGEKITNANNMFASCKALTTISTIEGTIATNIVLGSCPLDKETIKRLYKALSANASGKKITLKKTAVDAAFETSEGANDGGTSPEWLDMVDRDTGEKRNWEFILA